METGQRKDADGKTVPAHFIQTVTVTLNDRKVLAAQWGPAVAKNPFLQFSVGGAQKGDKLRVSWVDNKGDRRTDEAPIA